MGLGGRIGQRGHRERADASEIDGLATRAATSAPFGQIIAPQATLPKATLPKATLPKRDFPTSQAKLPKRDFPSKTSQAKLPKQEAQATKSRESTILARVTLG